MVDTHVIAVGQHVISTKRACEHVEKSSLNLHMEDFSTALEMTKGYASQ